MKERAYDLEKRLLEDAANIIWLVERLPGTRAGNHIARICDIAAIRTAQRNADDSSPSSNSPVRARTLGASFER
jgi:hypothetical protein